MMHMMQRAPQIARQLTGIWHDHEAALNEIPFIYLEHLIDAMLETGPMRRWDLHTKLDRVLPSILPGTITRLLNVRFGEYGDGWVRARNQM